MSQAQTRQQQAQRYARATADYVADNPWMGIVAWVLFIGLLTGLITVAIINLKPYMVLTQSIGGQTNWLFSIPIVGDWFRRLSVGFALIGGLLIWVPVQLLQCLWLVIGFDFKAQRHAVRESAAIERELNQIEGNRASRRTIRQASRIPFQFTRWASLLALAAYAFDLAVGLSVYPVWSDWNKFALWAKSFNPIWLNAANARDLLIMLFSFEAVLILVLIVAQWIWHRRDA